MNRSHRLASPLAALAAVLAVAGCSESAADAIPTTTDLGTSGTLVATITVEARPWTGWQRDQPAPVTNSYRVEDGTEIALERAVDDTTLRVEDVGDGEITLSVEGVAPSDGGLDLTDCGAHELTITPERSVEFGTCTLDGGTTWRVSVTP